MHKEKIQKGCDSGSFATLHDELHTGFAGLVFFGGSYAFVVRAMNLRPRLSVAATNNVGMSILPAEAFVS